jgi:peptide/nickel transport system substrate-binding protein
MPDRWNKNKREVCFMESKRILALGLVAAMGASMLAGCGQSTAKTASSAAASTQAAASSTVASTAAASPTAEETADATKGTTPRNETLYYDGLQWSKVNDWNPLSSNSNNMVMQQNDTARELVWETLFMYNMLDGKLYPLLAKDYAWNDAQTEMTIHMNPDAKFNDGSQVKASDVKATFDANVKYGTSLGADYANYIDTIDASDDTTLVIKAKLGKDGKAVNPLKVIDLIPKMYIMSEAYIKTVDSRNNGDADAIKKDVMDDAVSSGPYKKFYSDDQKVVLVRDEKYWGQAASMWGKLPAPKYIAHNIYKDNASGDTAFKAGEVDVSQQFTTDVQKLWQDDGLPISTYLDDAPYNLCAVMPSVFFNCEKPGLDNATVRKAIAMAVDYDQIIASAMSNQSPTFEQVPRSLMNPTDGEQKLVDNDALKDIAYTGKDVDGAKKLLDDAGIKDTNNDGVRDIDGKNLSFKVECPEGWSDWNAALEIVAAAGKNIGIDIETYFPDAPTWTTDYSTGNFDMIMYSLAGASISCPWTRAMGYLSSSYNDLKVNTVGNFGHYSNKDADKLLAEIPYVTDETTLKKDYTELSKIWLTDVPSFSLMYRPIVFDAVNESVWTNFPSKDDGSNIPPEICSDGYGIAALYQITNTK